MPQPRLAITDNWLTSSMEILSKVKEYSYSAKEDLFGPQSKAVQMSSEGDVNTDWTMLRKFEKLLGYKIVNWRDNETEIPNGSYIKLQRDNIVNEEKGFPLSIGNPDTNVNCLIGFVLLNDLTLTLKILENNEKKGEYEIKGNRLILLPGNSQLIIGSNGKISNENSEIYFQVFRFKIHTRPLDNNYWHRLDRQLTYRSYPCFSKELCDSIVAEAESTNWTTARHNLYPTTDIPVDNLVKNKDQINDLVKNKIFPWLEDWFGLPKSAMYMNDLFVVKYSAEGQRKLTIHRDVSIISFNVLLNEATDFEGGGTKFYYINKLVGIQKGEVLMHSGKMYHAGNEVTKGNRYIMVGFVGLNSDMVNHDLRKEIYKRTLTDEEVLNSLFMY